LFTADTLISLGEAHTDTGHLDAASSAWAEALAIKEKIGSHTDAEALRARLRQLDERTDSADEDTGVVSS
jgi:hypothetical protein